MQALICRTSQQSCPEQGACVCRVKQYHSRTPQYDQILKKNEQMHALLAMTLALCPAAQKNLDEVIMNQLRDK